MNEAETRAELIDPAIRDAGWGVVDGSRVRREFQITLGRLQGAGQRSKSDIADYVLTYRDHKLAVIEAKARDMADTEGVGQAKQYASKLGVRFTYSTNGEGIYQIDMATGEETYVSQYPSPDALWDLTFSEQSEWRDRFPVVTMKLLPDSAIWMASAWCRRSFRDWSASDDWARKSRKISAVEGCSPGSPTSDFRLPLSL